MSFLYIGVNWKATGCILISTFLMVSIFTGSNNGKQLLNTNDNDDYLNMDFAGQLNESDITALAQNFVSMLEFDEVNSLTYQLLMETGDIKRLNDNKWLESAILENYNISHIKSDEIEDEISCDLPIELEKSVALILHAINGAISLRNEAFENLTDAEMNFLIQNENEIYEMEGAELLEEEISLENIEDLFQDFSLGTDASSSLFWTLLNKIDMNKMAMAGKKIINAIRIAGPTLLKYRDAQLLDEGILFGDVLKRVVIGGPGSNNYTESPTLLIDLGGDDEYGGKSHLGSISVLIDLEGNDSYIANDMTQGSGYFGMGILFDFDGNDIYRSRNKSQGFGCAGIGILVDLFGNDSYSAESYSQGSATGSGIGILLDISGNDNYSAIRASQGMGMKRSLGLLIDFLGNDEYNSSTGSQGTAFLGGIGALVDFFGNDSYVSSEFSQGIGEKSVADGGIWMSMGSLLDISGDDSYLSGNFSQGVGKEMGMGALVDIEGNDEYLANDRESNELGILTDLTRSDGRLNFDINHSIERIVEIIGKNQNVQNIEEIIQGVVQRAQGNANQIREIQGIVQEKVQDIRERMERNQNQSQNQNQNQDQNIQRVQQENSKQNISKDRGKQKNIREETRHQQKDIQEESNKIFKKFNELSNGLTKNVKEFSDGITKGVKKTSDDITQKFNELSSRITKNVEKASNDITKKFNEL